MYVLSATISFSLPPLSFFSCFSSFPLPTILIATLEFGCKCIQNIGRIEKKSFRKISFVFKFDPRLSVIYICLHVFIYTATTFFDTNLNLLYDQFRFFVNCNSFMFFSSEKLSWLFSSLAFARSSISFFKFITIRCA